MIDLQKEGEKIGAEVYERIARDYTDLDYKDFRNLVEHIYAGIFHRVYEETYKKDRGVEYWNGNTKDSM